MKTLSILMDSELMSPLSSEELHLSGPGATQYLQSLACIATSISMDSPSYWDRGLTGGMLNVILNQLLQSSHYEVRQLSLERLQQSLERQQQHKSLPCDLSVSILTNLALHESHPTCLAKVRDTYVHYNYT